jgi:hypothetical protein
MVLGELAAALFSGAAVSAPMTIIDTAIIRAQFDKSTLRDAIKKTTRDLLTRKMTWNPSLHIMGTVSVTPPVPPPQPSLNGDSHHA